MICSGSRLARGRDEDQRGAHRTDVLHAERRRQQLTECRRPKARYVALLGVELAGEPAVVRLLYQWPAGGPVVGCGDQQTPTRRENPGELGDGRRGLGEMLDALVEADHVESGSTESNARESAPRQR